MTEMTKMTEFSKTFPTTFDLTLSTVVTTTTKDSEETETTHLMTTRKDTKESEGTRLMTTSKETIESSSETMSTTKLITTTKKKGIGIILNSYYLLFHFISIKC